MSLMKRDAIICALIACLTLAVPAIGYIVLTDNLLLQHEDALRRAHKFDEMARSVEDEKIKIRKDNLVASLRHYATAERVLSQMYANSHVIANYLVVFMGGVAVCQFALLYAFISRRRRAD